MSDIKIDYLDTPIGTLAIGSEDDHLLTLDFLDQEHAPGGDGSRFVAPLRAYFAGDLGALDTLPVRLQGTPFQCLVWEGLRRIPVGKTMSYGALARMIGKPDAVRAVGLANGANKISLVLPCHRVIGADGSLTGYGGGLWRKRWLLEHEGAVFSAPRAATPQ
ncbi:MAG TPA: methylated-DNA--[protein]-cysteine S-methyltransferase [Stellaceae bacterium]|nr:methylated-DNA--[protein]-cysteine S-methyltransferase [Stellaceae bacterium]